MAGPYPKVGVHLLAGAYPVLARYLQRFATRPLRGAHVSKSRWDSQEASIAIPFRLNCSASGDMKSSNSIMKLGICGQTTGEEMPQRPL